jgi:hypothetical protein
MHCGNVANLGIEEITLCPFRANCSKLFKNPDPVKDLTRFGVEPNPGPEGTLASVRASERLVDRLVDNRSITRAGRDWLIACLDPFHDTELHCSGYPDTNIGQSVVQVVKQTSVLSVPNGITGNWDAHIVTLPIWNNHFVAQYTNPNGNILVPIASSATQGTVSVQGFASGTDDWQVQNFVGLQDVGAYSIGAGRVIAAGIEVVNTTAEIYRQGQAIVYRVPQPTPKDEAFQFTSGVPPVVTGTASLHTLNNPPRTTEQAMLMSGSKQWAAAEGCYIPLVLNSPLLPVEQDPETGIVYESLVNGNTIASAVTTDATTGAGYIITPQKFMSFHTGGVIFTGLSNQSTLQLTSTFYIERFPAPANPDESDLVVLAKPSPEYDLLAQEIYSRCIATMPVGVMVKENGLGDWFRDVIRKVTDFTTPVLSAIPHPAFQGAAMISRGANMLTQPRKKPQQVVRKPQAQPAPPPRKVGKKSNNRGIASKRA